MVENETALSNLKGRLKHHIAECSKRVKRDKSKAYRYKLCVLLLTLIATLSLGLEWPNEYQQGVKNVAFFCSALVTFLTGIDLYYNHKGLWVQYVKTRNKLCFIQDDLDFYVVTVGLADVADVELKKFHDRLQECLDECNDWWVKERTNGNI